jgi:hypothetical protein
MQPYGAVCKIYMPLICCAGLQPPSAGPSDAHHSLCGPLDDGEVAAAGRPCSRVTRITLAGHHCWPFRQLHTFIPAKADEQPSPLCSIVMSRTSCQRDSTWPVNSTVAREGGGTAHIRLLSSHSSEAAVLERCRKYWWPWPDGPWPPWHGPPPDSSCSLSTACRDRMGRAGILNQYSIGRRQPLNDHITRRKDEQVQWMTDAGTWSQE